MAEAIAPQSSLKALIAKGKEQSYLTYAEVNDHLPESISDPDQVEDIIQMINDMGIKVFETERHDSVHPDEYIGHHGRHRDLIYGWQLADDHVEPHGNLELVAGLQCLQKFQGCLEPALHASALGERVDHR